jgi:hypothetical protein
MAIEVKTRVEREFGVVIPLMQLIKGPTVAEAARAIVGTAPGGTVEIGETAARAAAPDDDGRSLLLSILATAEPAPTPAE